MTRYHLPASIHLTILQLNVGRGAPAHEIALSLASEQTIDILLIQEPYIFSDYSRRITKRHPSYECFTPTDNWADHGRPRVLTYIRKDSGIRASQLRPPLNNPLVQPDILFLCITSPCSQSLLVTNIYNAPYGATRSGKAAEALRLLPTSFFSQPTIIAGDFNLLHSRWQPSLQRGPTPGAEPLVNWLDQSGLILASEVDRSTHNQGNVLDLTFISSSLLLTGACSTLADHLDATSDHRPILTTIPWGRRHPDSLQRLRFNTLDQALFFSLLSSNLTSLEQFPSSILELDSLALGLTEAIFNAYSGSAKRSLGKGTGHAWWNADCTKARDDFKAGLLDKRGFRTTVRKAQRQYWRNKLDTVTQSKDVFYISKWHKSIGSYRSPPLHNPLCPESPLAVSAQDKRSVLVQNLLQNTAEIGDIPLNSPAVPSTSLPFPDITLAQVETSILKAGNTAPGADELPTDILKVAWPLIKDITLRLFQGCLRLGYHPKCFRKASLVILEKPRKDDKSSPRSYRPIALLSTLGKGLERLIARNISWIAVTHKVLASQQFGALPLRSAVDLTTCLTHDVEEALNTGHTASLLTLDVKGAFDTVLPGRLVRRLREQGWPDNLTRWVVSFTTDRIVQIRLDGEVGPPTAIHCGLPQGSPVSPILFMLYLAPLFQIGTLKPKARFGYADDVAILAISPTLSKNCDTLSRVLQGTLDWGTLEGITFDPGKSELIHFSRKRTDQDPLSTPFVSAGPLAVHEGTDRPYIRWLGILFDKKLTFKWHVREMASKAATVANALRSLGNTVRGIPPYLLHQATTACVLRKAYYGAETWWPGRARTIPTYTSNRVDGLLSTLAKVVLTGARATLPVYYSTPTAALHRESGLLPPEIELNQITLKATTRLRRLDPYHPLYQRAKQTSRLNRLSSRFARRVIALPPSEQINPLVIPPWQSHEDRPATLSRIRANPGRTKEQAAASFLDFYSSIPRSDITLFSDGSKLKDGRTGGGFIGFQHNHQVTYGSFSLGLTKEVFDAEAEAALAGLKAAFAIPTARFANNLWICLDNLKVAEGLLSPSSGSSQSIFESFSKLASTWADRDRLPHTLPGAVRILWVPGHSNIPGNEAADQAAKAGAALPAPSSRSHSYASLKRIAKAYGPEALQQLWGSVAPHTYRELGITTSPIRPKELYLPRPLLGRIIASRTGHGDFAEYHERFNHNDAHIQCRCGSRKEPLHFFFCHIGKRRSPRPPGPPSEVIPFLLGTPKGAQQLGLWLSKNRFFEDICPRYPPHLALELD